MMVEERESVEELRARRAQVQRDIDFNKCMLGMLDSLSEKCIIVGELNRLWDYRNDLDELIARKEKTGDVS